ncbi:MAG TPA: exodeoxyribonuclease I [Nevskiaceae bacterium]|nr:exodeoxyribonuclease I [Nevskiaceae bacterium]
MPTPTLLWYDYETTGTDAAVDRPWQFGAQRTTLALEPVGEPINLYCAPQPDVLPQPEACLITGLTPQWVRTRGLAEAAFAAAVQAALAQPGTCSVGYNSVRFDDQVNRYLFYRNFFDPYAHTWARGTSRWDILDLARACHALRPEGIDWPRHEDGKPSFRLEDLARANHLEQPHAHDASSDVVATIDLARLLKQHQPRLYAWHFAARDKRAVAQRIAAAVGAGEPLVHVSSRYPSERGCLALVWPVVELKRSGQAWVVADLGVDPACWTTLDADNVRDRLYTAVADLPEGVVRPPLKKVRANVSPFLAPLKVLRDEDLARLHVDVDQARERLAQLRACSGLAERVREVFEPADAPDRSGGPAKDPELALYDRFVPDVDRALFDPLHAASPAQLSGWDGRFSDPRLAELLFRYRARNWPETLSTAEAERWREQVRARLGGRGPDKALTLAGYRAEIGRLRAATPAGGGQAILDQLQAWGDEVAAAFDVD